MPRPRKWRKESFCQKLNLPLAGRIPFDPDAVKAINNSQSIVEIDCAAGRAVKDVFDKTLKGLQQPLIKV